MTAGAQTVLDHIIAHAQRAPDQPALLIDDVGGTAQRVTYGALVARALAIAEQVRRRGGRPGDRCGLQARGGQTFIESALGILAAGLCLVPIADEYEGEWLERFVVATRLHHLLQDQELMSRQAEADCHDAEFRALRPAYLRFTSGSAALPKGVVIGHQSVLERIDVANRGLNVGPDDRILWLLPMAHHFVVSILLYLRFGATILLPGSSLARHALTLAERARATVLYASPFHYQLLAKDSSMMDLPAVRLAVSTATGLRSATAEAFKARFGIDLIQALGIIEVGLPLMNIVSAATKPTAIGRPLPGFDVHLLDEGGMDVTRVATGDAPGEVCIRGPGMFDAYLDPWALAEDVITPDGFRTGDQGWFDADGDLHLVGRRDNRVSMAGMKFFCEEVEAVLDAHPGVSQSRVMARAHAHLGEVPVAEVVPADPARPPTHDDLVDHCRRRLPAYKIPRAFEVVSELPLTLTGKVRRT